MSSSQLMTSRLHWQFAPGWDTELMGPDGPCVERWLREGRGQIIKHGAHRTVYRVDLPQRTLFIKHYRCPRWLGALRHLFDASHSRREWRKTLEVARRQIPTARPVAIAEQQQGWFVRDNYYVSEGIPQSQSLDDYVRKELDKLPLSERARRRRLILEALGRLLAAAHSAGIEHNDLHTGNILIRWPAAGDLPELYLIDLPGIRIGESLNWTRSRDSLAMLGGGWLEQLSRSDRWRFWREYLQHRAGSLCVPPIEASQQVLVRTRRHARRVAAMRDKRSMKNNRDFQRLRAGMTIACAVQEFPRETLLALIEDPAGPLRRHRHEPVKLGHGSVVVEAQMPLAERQVRVAFKRSRPRHWWKHLASVVRASRSLSGWRTGHALLARGIATARPLAAIQPAPWGGESYLATAWIEGALNLHLYGWELAGQQPHERHRRACQTAESLGRLIGRMHAWRISHGDLKGCNLVAREEPGRVATYLIDLDSVRFLRRLSPSRQAKDLARLAASTEAHPWLSRTVRLRFVQAYLRELGGSDDWKDLWKQLSRRTQPILARFARHGRPAA